MKDDELVKEVHKIMNGTLEKIFEFFNMGY